MAESILSIIVPVYNADGFLENCLQSIISQSFTSWECILVNDGSVDRSAEICDSIASTDDRFRVIHKNNGGASSARNRGIVEARGKWITFIDADDFIGETFLKGLMQPILDGEKVDFVHGGCINYENGQASSVNQEYDYYVGDNKGKLFRSFRGLVVSKLFNVSILLNNRLLFDEKMRVAEDMAFTMDYLCFVGSYAFVPEKSYYYRRDNEASATHIKKWNNYQQYRQGFTHLYNSTVRYVESHSINEADSRLRYEQRTAQYFEVLRSMYHDRNLSRTKRMEILQNDFKAGLFQLFQYINVKDNRYPAVKLLSQNKFYLFDIRQSMIEVIEEVKECIKFYLR